MRKLFIVVAALALGGCAFFQSYQNPITRERLYGLEASYGIIVQQAETYHHLPRCSAGAHFSLTNPCKEPVVIAAIKAADRRVHTALVVARSFVRNNPTLDASVVISNVQDAVAAFRAATPGVVP